MIIEEARLYRFVIINICISLLYNYKIPILFIKFRIIIYKPKSIDIIIIMPNTLD